MKPLSFRKYSFQTLTQFSQDNNMVHAPASNTDGFFKRYMSFFNSVKLPYLEENVPVSNMKMIICRLYSFQAVTHFSQEINLLDAAASNANIFLGRDTCVSSLS
jgi:hypothetical protein